MSHSAKEIVRQGYDRISYAYRGNGEEDPRYTSWLSELIPLIPARAPVLDLGCGCGIPATKLLASQFDVTGVDISPVQIGRARELISSAKFLCADMASIDFTSHSFNAIVSLYAIIHVPLDEQRALFHKVRQWLKPDGYFMAIVGHTAWSGTDPDWLVPGAAMFWSHTDCTTYENWLQESGFSLVWQRFIPEGDGGHTLILAQAMSSSG